MCDPVPQRHWEKGTTVFPTYFPIADNPHFSGMQVKYILTEQLVSPKNTQSNGIVFFLKRILIHTLKHENNETKSSESIKLFY